MQNITSLIAGAIHTLYGVEFVPTLSVAPKPDLGEYCTNVFPLAKSVGKAPNIIAGEVASELAKHTDIFVSTSATGGYVNFFLTDTVWIELFSSLDQPTNRPTDQGTIIVDYIGANVGKPLHIGHLCTPSIGQAIINIYRYIGYNVIGDTHVGDWGLFGKLIAAHKLLGRVNGIEEKGVEYLLELYIQITAKCEQDPNIEEYCRNEFKKLSEGDEENMKLWGKFTTISLKSMNAILAKINVVPDFDIGESFYEDLPLPKIGNQPPLEYTMNDIIHELLGKKIAIKNEDGSIAVIFPENTKLPSIVIQKKNGTNLYITADICAIKYRLTNGWNPSKLIYSVDVRQQLHLRQAFAIAQMAWPELTKEVEFFHAFNGFIKLKEGAMSTRHGTVIFLQALIDEGNERTTAILEEKGRTGENALKAEDIQAITVGAIKYSYLAQDREKDVTFDWDKALSFEGNSGPYIQYAYVRAKKIVSGLVTRDSGLEVPTNDELRITDYDKSLIQVLARIDEVIHETAEKYKPHILALYCYDVAVTFNSFYVHTPKILEESDEHLKDFRLALVEKTTETLKLGFSLLGIEMPSEM